VIALRSSTNESTNQALAVAVVTVTEGLVPVAPPVFPASIGAVVSTPFKEMALAIISVHFPPIVTIMS